MKEPIYNDDVERTVNPRTAKARQRADRRAARLLLVIAAMLAGILAGIVLWLLNVNGGIVTIMVTEAMSCVAAFAAGRLWEIVHK